MSFLIGSVLILGFLLLLLAGDFEQMRERLEKLEERQENSRDDGR